MHTLTPIDYLLIGHITADLTPQGRVAGGTVTYAARTAHAFGLRVGVVTSAAADDAVLDALTPYAQVALIPADATTTFENIYTPEGRIQYIRATAAPIREIPAVWRDAPLIHLAPIAAEVDAAILATLTGGTRLLTLQGWLRRWDTSGKVLFQRWHNPDVLKALDYVVLSSEDIRESPDLAVALARDGRCVIITQAEHGGIYYRDGDLRRYKTPHIEVINPTGAGDVFAASLLAALPRVASLESALNVAAHLAAESVMRTGLDSAPTAESVTAALSRVT